MSKQEEPVVNKQDVQMTQAKSQPVVQQQQQPKGAIFNQLQAKNIAKVKAPPFDDLCEMNLPGFSIEAMEERFALASTQETLLKMTETPRACLGMLAQKARKVMGTA